MKTLASCLLAIGLIVPGFASSDPSATKVETLLRAGSSWDGVPYKAYPAGKPELSVLKITIPPHTALQWHGHPIPNAAYVISGELTVELKQTGEKRAITAGQALAEVVDTIHRGVSGNEPVVLIVFYTGAAGVPLSQ